MKFSSIVFSRFTTVGEAISNCTHLPRKNQLYGCSSIADLLNVRANGQTEKVRARVSVHHCILPLQEEDVLCRMICTEHFDELISDWRNKYRNHLLTPVRKGTPSDVCSLPMEHNGRRPVGSSNLRKVRTLDVHQRK